MSDKNIILKIENISKQYRLGLVGTGTISHDLNRWWHKVRGKEDPFLKIGETNNRATKGESDYVWALKDINFEVKQGEVLGIIGKNGAGKSTLLKLLSRVTGPTTGSIKSAGRIASLLEVGTGFHPELTGKENVFLNGAILGMTKAEIRAKLDEIIEFSGCERFVDTPVKRYSSGMRVRLAFAVAAFLEPDILVVDEVLAVGDVEFQKKAIGKMKDISQGGGRTVLFVSHNMASVASLCTRGLVLKNGLIDFVGGVNQSITHYLKDSGRESISNQWVVTDKDKIAVEGIELLEASVYVKDQSLQEPISTESPIDFSFKVNSKSETRKIGITCQFKGENGDVLFVNGSGTREINGSETYVCSIPANFFNEGEFSINVLLIEEKEIGIRAIHLEDDLLGFVVNPGAREIGQWMGKTKGSLKPKFNWT